MRLGAVLVCLACVGARLVLRALDETAEKVEKQLRPSTAHNKSEFAASSLREYTRAGFLGIFLRALLLSSNHSHDLLFVPLPRCGGNGTSNSQENPRQGASSL